MPVKFPPIEPVSKPNIPGWRIREAIRTTSIARDLRKARKLLKKHGKSPSLPLLLEAQKLVENIIRLEREP